MLKVIVSICWGLLAASIVGGILSLIMKVFTAGLSHLFINIAAIIIWLFALAYGTIRGVRYWKKTQKSDLLNE